MSNRTDVRNDLSDPESIALDAAAPIIVLLAIIGIGLSIVAGVLIANALANGATALAIGMLTGLVLIIVNLWRFLPSANFFFLAAIFLFERILAWIILPEPRPEASSHDRIRRHVEMARVRRRLRYIGLGAGWIGSGAAILDRRGRVRLLRRPRSPSCIF